MQSSCPIRDAMGLESEAAGMWKEKKEGEEGKERAEGRTSGGKRDGGKE